MVNGKIQIIYYKLLEFKNSWPVKTPLVGINNLLYFTAMESQLLVPI